MSFNTAPTVDQFDTVFTLAAGEKMTLSLYNAAGSGLKSGAVGLIQQEVSTGPSVWKTQDALTATRDSLLWEAEGSWRVRKLATPDEAVGVIGVGGS